jgi:hypothetical protein
MYDFKFSPAKESDFLPPITWWDELKFYFWICSSVFVVMVIGVYLLFRPDYVLTWVPFGVPYTTTRFEFHYGVAPRIIEDPHNQLRFIYGEYPDSITVKNNERIIVFNSPKCALKSWTDSIGVGEYGVHHKGYMGVTDHELEYVIDKEGVLHCKREFREVANN